MCRELESWRREFIFFATQGSQRLMNIMHNLPKRRVGRSSVSLWTQSQAIKKKNKKPSKQRNRTKQNATLAITTTRKGIHSHARSSQGTGGLFSALALQGLRACLALTVSTSSLRSALLFHSQDLQGNTLIAWKTGPSGCHLPPSCPSSQLPNNDGDLFFIMKAQPIS